MEIVVKAADLNETFGNFRSCNGSMEAMDGSYTGPGGHEELEEEEFMNPLSPSTSKRLKVSDINISR